MNKNELKAKRPCTFSIKELKKSTNEAIKAYKAGDRTKFVSHEEMKKKYTL